MRNNRSISIICFTKLATRFSSNWVGLASSIRYSRPLHTDSCSQLILTSVARNSVRDQRGRRVAGLTQRRSLFLSACAISLAQRIPYQERGSGKSADLILNAIEPIH
jgi:hypothetical protein